MWRNGWLVPCAKTMSPISYQFNITWLNIIIVKEYVSSLITFMPVFQNAPSNP